MKSHESPNSPFSAARPRLKRVFSSLCGRAKPPSSSRNPLSPSPWSGQQAFQDRAPKSKFLAAGVLISLLYMGCRQPETSAAGNEASSRFRVASYNIRYPAQADEDSGNGWNTRKQPLVNLMVSHGFDLIGTQEGYIFQLDDIKSMMPGFEYISYPYGGESVRHQCATFYKVDLYEAVESGVFWLSETPEVSSIGWDATDSRICVWTKFKVKETGKIFYFFNVHFYWRLEIAKAASGPLMARKIKEIAGDAPVICTGDFNSTIETPQMEAVKEILSDACDLTETPREGVENTNLGGGVFQGDAKNRIDFIFVSDHFQVEDYKVLSDRYGEGRYPSDHLPVTSLLMF